LTYRALHRAGFNPDEPAHANNLAAVWTALDLSRLVAFATAEGKADLRSVRLGAAGRASKPDDR